MDQKERIEKLEAFLIGYCNCPCCNENKECDPECTFSVDCPEDYEKMQQAREVYWDGKI